MSMQWHLFIYSLKQHALQKRELLSYSSIIQNNKHTQKRITKLMYTISCNAILDVQSVSMSTHVHGMHIVICFTSHWPFVICYCTRTLASALAFTSPLALRTLVSALSETMSSSNADSHVEKFGIILEVQCHRKGLDMSNIKTTMPALLAKVQNIHWRLQSVCLSQPRKPPAQPEQGQLWAAAHLPRDETLFKGDQHSTT